MTEDTLFSTLLPNPDCVGSASLTIIRASGIQKIVTIPRSPAPDGRNVVTWRFTFSADTAFCPPTGDSLLDTPLVRTLLMQLLDSSNADSSVSKRKETGARIYFNPSTGQFLTVFPTSYNVHTGCEIVPIYTNPGAAWTLTADFHSHPYTVGIGSQRADTLSGTNCGPDFAGEYYKQGLSRADREAQLDRSANENPGNAPHYAIDKTHISASG